MAKSKKAEDTSFKDFLDALDEIQRNKGIDKERLIAAVEEALISAYKRDFKGSQNARAQIDRQTGAVRVFAQKTVVETVENPASEVSLEQAREINELYEPGDFVEEELNPKVFGRVAAQNAKQMILQRIKDAERNLIYDTFTQKVGDLVSGMISRIDKNEIHVELDRYEGTITHANQIPNESYYQGMRIKVIISEVSRTPKGPQIILSRSTPMLISRLFEREIPEVFDGVVEIVSIAREAGSRTKIAVKARTPDVDAVGACVGFKGTRIANILSEIGAERIDVVEYEADMERFIKNALAPAAVIKIDVNEQSHSAQVLVNDDQLSLAIGKEGQNVRMAAKLTGYKIDIKSVSKYNETEAANSFTITSIYDEDENQEDSETDDLAESELSETSEMSEEAESLDAVEAVEDASDVADLPEGLQAEEPDIETPDRIDDIDGTGEPQDSEGDEPQEAQEPQEPQEETGSPAEFGSPEIPDEDNEEYEDSEEDEDNGQGDPDGGAAGEGE